jgi:hypothetical protein
MIVPHALHTLCLCASGSRSCSNKREVLLDIKCLEAAGDVVAKRCAESCRYRRRAENSEEPIPKMVNLSLYFP